MKMSRVESEFSVRRISCPVQVSLTPRHDFSILVTPTGHSSLPLTTAPSSSTRSFVLIPEPGWQTFTRLRYPLASDTEEALSLSLAIRTDETATALARLREAGKEFTRVPIEMLSCPSPASYRLRRGLADVYITPVEPAVPEELPPAMGGTQRSSEYNLIVQLLPREADEAEEAECKEEGVEEQIVFRGTHDRSPSAMRFRFRTDTADDASGGGVSGSFPETFGGVNIHEPVGGSEDYLLTFFIREERTDAC